MLSGGLRTKKKMKRSLPGEPLITIITVVRNGEATIEETILSIINQTHQNVEYIIIDGKSTDKTLEIIKKYEDRIDYWMSEPDNGIYDAMNKGIILANGEWINFMNSGDSFYTNHIVEDIFLNIAFDADVIYGNTCKIYPNYSRVDKPPSLEFMRKSMPFCHQSSFAKTKLMRQYKFDLKYRYVADNKFFYILYQNKSKFVYVDKIIANYDAYYGFSSVSIKNSLYENYQIRNGKLPYSIWYSIYYLPVFIKHQIALKYYSWRRKNVLG